METRILITDNDLFLGELYQGFLSALPNLHFDLAVSPKNCRDYLDNSRYDLLFMDIDLGDPEENGIDMLRSLRHQFVNVPIVMISSRDDAMTINECIRLGADCFMSKSKGFVLDLVQMVADFSDNRQLQRLPLTAG